MIQKRTAKGGEARYAVRIRTGTNDQGKPEFRFKTFATKGEAQKWEREQLRAVDRGEFFEASQEPLGRYLGAWLDNSAAMVVRPRTLAGYRRLLNRYIRGSELAAKPLARLTTQDIERHYRELGETKGLSARTVRLTHSILRAALGKAERDRLISRNPAVRATLPRQVRREMHALDARQVSRLLGTSEATETVGTRFGPCW